MTKGANSEAETAVGESRLDLLWGVDAIAAELNLTRRQTYHQLESGRLPARKQGGKWVSSRAGIRRYFEAIVAGEVK